MDVVTAVVPVFNRYEYLAECLNSVFSQTRAPDEVLVVDDCSTPPTREFLATTPSHDRVTVLRTDRNRGVAGARNWGWKNARGNLIAYLDSDDIWEPQKLEIQLRHLQQNPEADGVYGSMTAFYPDGSTEPYAHDRPPRVTVASALSERSIHLQTLLIRRSALERIGGFDEGFGILDDREITIRLAVNGIRIDFLSTPPLTLYRRNDSNLSKRMNQFLREDLRLNRKYGALMEKTLGPGTRRVHLAYVLRRYGRRVRYCGLPTRIAARLLCMSAPHSRMERPEVRVLS